MVYENIMSNVGNLLITLGFVIVIVFSTTSFYTSLNVATDNTEFLELTGLDNYDEYNDLYETEHDKMSEDSSFQLSDLGDIIFGDGYSSLKNVFDGSWLVITTNILVTSLGFAPVSGTIIAILVSILGMIFLLIVLGALLNRILIGGNK